MTSINGIQKGYDRLEPLIKSNPTIPKYVLQTLTDIEVYSHVINEEKCKSKSQDIIYDVTAAEITQGKYLTMTIDMGKTCSGESDITESAMDLLPYLTGKNYPQNKIFVKDVPNKPSSILLTVPLRDPSKDPSLKVVVDGVTKTLNAISHVRVNGIDGIIVGERHSPESKRIDVALAKKTTDNPKNVIFFENIDRDKASEAEFEKNNLQRYTGRLIGMENKDTHILPAILESLRIFSNYGLIKENQPQARVKETISKTKMTLLDTLFIYRKYLNPLINDPETQKLEIGRKIKEALQNNESMDKFHAIASPLLWSHDNEQWVALAKHCLAYLRPGLIKAGVPSQPLDSYVQMNANDQYRFATLAITDLRSFQFAQVIKEQTKKMPKGASFIAIVGEGHRAQVVEFLQTNKQVNWNPK
jgi:hypothetical protein